MKPNDEAEWHRPDFLDDPNLRPLEKKLAVEVVVSGCTDLALLVQLLNGGLTQPEQFRRYAQLMRAVGGEFHRSAEQAERAAERASVQARAEVAAALAKAAREST